MDSERADPNTPPVLGCIADDVTGATDLASNLLQGGMSVVQWMELPSAGELQSAAADAVVLALKTRSISAEEAVSQSLAGLQLLRAAGCRRFFFKYCSTFDSTPAGNIGPVAEALLDALGVPSAVFCPAFPRNGRTVYQGHLFVHDRLLHESGMQHHPLNPMTDPDIVRWLARQTQRQVGRVVYGDVVRGADHLRTRLTAATARLIVVDACDDEHLRTIAEAVADHVLVTGGSGVARYLPAAYRSAGITRTAHTPLLGGLPAGRTAILAGSCSQATQRQIAAAVHRWPSWRVDVEALMHDAAGLCDAVLQWAREQDPAQPLLVYSTAPSAEVAAVQERFGSESAARAIERFHGSLARSLHEYLDVRRLIIAGGETAGSVLRALGIRALRIGAEICPGVPWTLSLGDPPLALALKSGNFGTDDFFERALRMEQIG